MEKYSLVIPTFDPRILESKLFQTEDINLHRYAYNTSNIFHIKRIEDYLRNITTPTEIDHLPHRLSVFHFVYLIYGKCIRTKGLSTFEFGRNTFFFEPAFEIRAHEFTSDDAQGFYTFFNLDLLSFDYKLRDLLSDFPFLNFNSNPVIIIDDKSKKNFTFIFERLENEYKKGKDCRIEVLRAYLITLFVELMPFFKDSPSSNNDVAHVITEKFRKALARCIYEKQKVEDYAIMLKIPANKLNKYVKSVTGENAHELLNEMILLESKVLLKQTTLSISEISYKLGQVHISNFVRLFKSKTGMSPGEYRNSANDRT
jgi:AraC family transcriptional regulator, transcriptional activator of pobA